MPASRRAEPPLSARSAELAELAQTCDVADRVRLRLQTLRLALEQAQRDRIDATMALEVARTARGTAERQAPQRAALALLDPLLTPARHRNWDRLAAADLPALEDGPQVVEETRQFLARLNAGDSRGDLAGARGRVKPLGSPQASLMPDGSRKKTPGRSNPYQAPTAAERWRLCRV